MTSREANAEMQAHYREHKCGGGECDEAAENYAAYLTALAAEINVHPQSFPGVRKWMRMRGQEPIPMEEAYASPSAS